MADVFLSYRNTEERRRLVGRLATILRAHGISVWWDYGLEAGESYRDQITRALFEARIVVPVWCEESVKSNWVLMEAELGKDKLLPVRFQKVTPPSQFEALHAAHLESWDGSILDPALDEFVRDLCKRLGISPMLPPDTRGELAQLPRLKPLGPPRAAAAGSTPRSRVPLYAGLGLVLALFAGGVAWWTLKDIGLQPQTAPEEVVAVVPTVPASAVNALNDPLLSQQWHLMGPDKNGIGALDYSLRKGTRGKGVVIAAIGTGVYLPHPDLATSRNFLPGADMISDATLAADGDGRDTDPSDPGDSCEDARTMDSQHSTYGASLLMAPVNDGIGLAGMTPDAKFIAVRAVGRCGGKLSDINYGIRWAAGLDTFVSANGDRVGNTNPADVIALPLGLASPCPASLQEAIDAAAMAGAIVVAAAGDQKTDVRAFSPAGCLNVIAVGATDKRGYLSPYSNFGADVDLLAPGGDNQQDGDGDGKPDGIVGARYTINCAGGDGGVCAYSLEQGSSQAAMLVAGALALIQSAHPTENDDQVIARLMASTTPRTTMQCSGACDKYPGADRVPGLPDVCFRKCGVGLLDLTKAN
jgi:hypothetical protein